MATAPTPAHQWYSMQVAHLKVWARLLQISWSIRRMIMVPIYFNNPGSTPTPATKVDVAHRAWWTFGTNSGHIQMSQVESIRSGPGMPPIRGAILDTAVIALLHFIS